MALNVQIMCSSLVCINTASLLISCIITKVHLKLLLSKNYVKKRCFSKTRNSLLCQLERVSFELFDDMSVCTLLARIEIPKCVKCFRSPDFLGTSYSLKPSCLWVCSDTTSIQRPLHTTSARFCKWNSPCLKHINCKENFCRRRNLFSIKLLSDFPCHIFWIL